jgi:FKBP-type peptidyl-prolyl cis-trans isomerase FklB
MNLTRTFALNALLLAVVGSAQMSYSEESQIFRTPTEKVNYAIGVEIASNYKSQGIDLDLEMVVKGLKDGVTGGKLLIPEKELRNILISVQSDLRRKRSVAKRSVSQGDLGKTEDQPVELKGKSEALSQGKTSP